MHSVALHLLDVICSLMICTDLCPRHTVLLLQEAQRQAAETALQGLRQEAQSNLDNANAAKAQLQSELITAQQKMASLQKERAEVCCLPLH